MKRLNQLIGKLEDITLGDMPNQYLGGDMFEYLQEFFSREEVKEAIIEMNQSQMFRENVNREGDVLGKYSYWTSKAKASRFMPNTYYTFYETGSFYASMGVDADYDSVTVTYCKNPMGKDYAFGTGSREGINQSDIEDMFDTYDPSRLALGLTEENLEDIVNDETYDLKGHIIRNLKEYLNG